MTIQPSGDGVFTVRSSVRDARGRVVTGTEEIEDVRFAVGDLVEEPGRQPHYTSRIVHAERRFADDPASAFARDGVKLALYVQEGKTGTLEVRFDTPEGTGSFWETVRRASGASTPRGLESPTSPLVPGASSHASRPGRAEARPASAPHRAS